jgi:phosphoglycerate dehydrogenase-like enzyme
MVSVYRARALKKGLRLNQMGNQRQWTISEKQGFWDQVLELKDKTVGILGLGTIGKEVARLARARAQAFASPILDLVPDTYECINGIERAP